LNTGDCLIEVATWAGLTVCRSNIYKLSRYVDEIRISFGPAGFFSLVSSNEY